MTGVESHLEVAISSKVPDLKIINWDWGIDFFLSDALERGLLEGGLKIRCYMTPMLFELHIQIQIIYNDLRFVS